MQTLVVSHWACAMRLHMHGTCALTKTNMSMYSSDLACMQADQSLPKITTSHFQVLNTQNANEKMPNMTLIAYLNKNITSCNENLAWVNENPSFIPMCFGTSQCTRSWSKLNFTFFSCSHHKIYINPILILIEFQYTSTAESCLGSVPHAGPPEQPVWIPRDPSCM